MKSWPKSYLPKRTGSFSNHRIFAGAEMCQKTSGAVVVVLCCFVLFWQTAGENVQLKSLKSRLFAALERVNIDPAEFLKDDERKIRMEKAPSLVLKCFM